MEKLQAKGELDEEELRALEMDVTGKVQHPVSSHYHTKVSRRLDHARIMAWCKAGSYPGPSRGSISVLYASQSANYSKQVVDNVLKEPNQPDVVLYNRARVSPLSPLFLEFS